MIDRRLQVLRTVAACGTVTGAAEVLHYTPSAVSQQVRSLARDLGVDLFTQDGRRIRLTPAARVLLARSDELFAAWEAIRAEVAAAGGEDGGTLRLCGFSTAAAALLPPVVVTLRSGLPRCRVRIVEAGPRECFEMLLADEADIAVVVATSEVPASADPRFEIAHLLDDPLDLLVPEGHRLAGRREVGLPELVDEPWVMDRPGSPYHQLLQTACASAGFTPVVAHQATEWDTGAALVGAGLGVALVPRLAHMPTGYGVVRVSLTGDPVPARHILTGIRRGSGGRPTVAAALAAMAEVAASFAETGTLEGVD